MFSFNQIDEGVLVNNKKSICFLWRALRDICNFLLRCKKLVNHSKIPPDFLRASITRYTHARHELILNVCTAIILHFNSSDDISYMFEIPERYKLNNVPLCGSSTSHQPDDRKEKSWLFTSYKSKWNMTFRVVPRENFREQRNI